MNTKEFLDKDIKFPITLDDVLIKIWVTINPKFWIKNHFADSKLNKKILMDMKTHKFEFSDSIKGVDKYHAKLNGSRVWTQNYPYAFGGELTRSTIYKLKRKYDKELDDYKIHKTWKKL